MGEWLGRQEILNEEDAQAGPALFSRRLVLAARRIPVCWGNPSRSSPGALSGPFADALPLPPVSPLPRGWRRCRPRWRRRCRSCWGNHRSWFAAGPGSSPTAAAPRQRLRAAVREGSRLRRRGLGSRGRRTERRKVAVESAAAAPGALPVIPGRDSRGLAPTLFPVCTLCRSWESGVS